MQAISTFTDPFYTLSTSLDGTDYLLEFRHNQREDTWYFSVLLTDGTLLAAGLKVVCNFPLLRKCIHASRPRGELIAFSKTQDTSPPGLDALGEDRRVTLFYVTAQERAGGV